MGELATIRKVGMQPGRKWLLLVFAGLLVVFLLAGLSEWKLSQHAGEVEHLFASWRTACFAGPLWCIGLQALQVVFFFIPGEVLSFAAGYVFGTWHGLAYSFAGVMLGSVFDFCLARLLGRPALARIVSVSSLDRVDRLLAGTRGKLAFFLLFLFPLAPADALCYGAAFTGISLLEFAAISGAGRLPGLLFNIFLGARASRQSAAFVIVTGLVVLAILAILYRYWRRESARRTAVAAKIRSNHSDVEEPLLPGFGKTDFPYPSGTLAREGREPSVSQ